MPTNSSFGTSSRDPGAWRATAVGLAVVVAGACAAFALAGKERSRFSRAAKLQAASLGNDARSRLESRAVALGRVASAAGSGEAEARRLLEQDAACRGITRFDASGRPRWTLSSTPVLIPPARPARALLPSLRGESPFAVAHRTEAGEDEILLFVGGTHEGRLDGAVAGVFHSRRLLEGVLRDGAADGFGVAIFADGVELCRRGPPPEAGQSGWAEEAEIPLEGANWRVRVWPRREALGEARSAVPALAMTASILLGFAIAALLHLSRTARRRARLEQEARARLGSIVESSEDAVLGATPEGLILDANPAASRFFGCPEPELLGRSLESLSPPARREELGARLERLRRGERIEPFETLRCRGGGEIVEVSMALSAVRDATGAMVGISSIERDVSHRRRMQERLALTGRLASIGTLASGVAHEINNPLSYVIANLAQVSERLRALEGAAELEDLLRRSREGAERVRQIVRDLRSFARGDEERRSPVDLRSVIDSAIQLSWNEIRHRAKLVREIQEAPPVEGDEARLAQVFLNLLLNAAQAIPEGHADRNEIRVGLRAVEGRVVAEVRDTGCGIPRENLPRIFDPFFSTKPVGSGMGLGLSVCHGIVVSHGGDISVESEPGKGSAFRVSFPAVAKTPASSSLPAVAPAPSRAGRSRVLVVDDESEVGGAIRRALGRGHDVEVFTDARAALHRIAGGASFDLILCDLMMPEMTGMDLHAALVRECPAQAARVVFMTGGAFTPRARAFLDDVPNRRIEKPFDLEEIRRLAAEGIGADVPVFY